MRCLFNTTLLILFLFSSPASANKVLCPQPEEEGISVKGPNLKTNQREVTTATCRYFADKKFVGLIVGKFASSYKFGQNLCKSGEYFEALIRSEENQAYVIFKDIKPYDDIGEGHWEFLSLSFLTNIEEWAIPCNVDKKMFKRPLDIRKSRK